MATTPFPLPSSRAATNRARFTRIRSIAVRKDSSFNPAASVNHGSKMTTDANPMILHIEKTKERIKKMFNGDELSISSYDTAWVAMVPSFNSQEDPRFPQCVNWLLDNQLCDGSWGLSHRHQFLLRDTISSTLACVLALKRWGVGEEKINKGLQFIELNFASATDDEKQLSPVGFEIIFPGMIEYAKDLNLDIPIKPGDVNAMIHKRNLELKRAQETNCKGKEAYMAYVSEGLGKLQDWEMVMKYQRKNGSLFNSPSTTAAALIHLPIFNCFNYLDSILKKFGNAVPTVYPLDIYTRLWMVDMLERMGIDWHFTKEIGNVLDETYRRWQQTDEEIFLDTATCAMAFQILRFHGYDVSSEPVSQFPDEDHYSSSLCSHMKDTRAALELFRASELKYSDEPTLEKQSLWLSLFLRQELSCGRKVSDHVIQEVNDALQFPFHANLGRLKNRSSIENYNVVDMKMLKTSYRSSIFGNKDFLDLAVEDFNMCQSIHLEELKQLERWVVDNKLDQLPFARKKLAYCYFSAAASLVPPHLSDARISWAKNGVLTTVVDDFFDVGGSEEELANLIYLLEKWDVNVDTDCSSEQVKIVFSALRSTICEIGDKALAWQERNVTSHIIEIWLDLVRSMWREAEWVRTKSLPTVDEYMENGYVSFALGPIVLPALYLVGPRLSEEAVGSIEFHNLFKFMSTCGRLLNDIQTVEREAKEGKLNAVLLRMVHSNGAITKEENVKEMRDVGEQTRKELLRMVLQNEGSVVPRACKDLFWKMSKVVHFFYIKDDGFSSHELVNVVKELIHQPIVLQS